MTNLTLNGINLTLCLFFLQEYIKKRLRQRILKFEDLREIINIHILADHQKKHFSNCVEEINTVALFNDNKLKRARKPESYGRKFQ